MMPRISGGALNNRKRPEVRKFSCFLTHTNRKQRKQSEKIKIKNKKRRRAKSRRSPRVRLERELSHSSA